MMIDKVITAPTSGSTDEALGSFRMDKASESWYQCRETFESHWKPNIDLPFFYVMGREVEVASVATFMQKVEELLELPVEQQSQYAKTTRKPILWTLPGTFWKVDIIRRSFFTALLRASVLYKPGDPDNFETALFTQKYLEGTKAAVMRFLYGFVHPDLDAIRNICGFEASHSKGWYAIFFNKTNSQIKQMLKGSPGQQPVMAHTGDDLWC